MAFFSKLIKKDEGKPQKTASKRAEEEDAPAKTEPKKVFNAGRLVLGVLASPHVTEKAT
ncbi:MAG: hypothetical protein HYW88_00790, partial [Candidatus Sungbacteria bacterium]|nr:hypothetical protein [Candidatus Sungbacteria bacterium]